MYDDSKYSKPLKIGIAIFLVIVIITVIGVVVRMATTSDSGLFGSMFQNSYTVHYYDKMINSYDFEPKDDYIVVKKLSQPNCIQAPCNPMVIGEFHVDYTDEYRDLFEKLFENNDSKEISINSKDLSKEERVVLSKILSQ